MKPVPLLGKAPGQTPAKTTVSTDFFPRLTADAMDKSTIVVPTQLKGQVNLLLLSWARDQDGQLATWTAIGQALEHTHPNVRVYTILVSSRENPLFRWWDNASLRESQTDPELLPWTLALYTDEAALRRKLGVPNERSIVALLVDRSGKILWKAIGPSSASTRGGLLAAVPGS